MRFLKLCVVVALPFILNACAGKSTQPALAAAAPQEAAPTMMPAVETEPQPQSENLPSFAVLDAGGNTVDLQQFKGKKVFVNLWATWCPPCRAEMPSIEKLYQAADKEKVQFVMLSLDNDFESAKKYVQEKGFSLPVFYPAADLPKLFTVQGIPTTFIFDESGRLVAQHEGSENYNTAAFRKLFGAAK